MHKDIFLFYTNIHTKYLRTSTHVHACGMYMCVRVDVYAYMCMSVVCAYVLMHIDMHVHVCVHEIESIFSNVSHM